MEEWILLLLLFFIAVKMPTMIWDVQDFALFNILCKSWYDNIYCKIIVIDNINLKLEIIITMSLLYTRTHSCASDKSSIENQAKKLLKKSEDTPIAGVCLRLFCQLKYQWHSIIQT